MSKFTPGPWALGEIENERGELTHYVKSSEDDFVTYALPRTSAHPALMANAELISAAPDLFEACALLLVELNGKHNGSKALREALAKAGLALDKARGIQ